MKEIRIRDVVLQEKKATIAIPLIAKDLLDLENQLKDVPFDEIEVIEWRVDHYKAFLDDEAVNNALNLIRTYLQDKVLIATFRTLWEGGASAINKENYVHLLKYLLESKKVDIIDLELFAQKNDILKEIIDYAHLNQVYVIMSNHEFERTLSYNDMIKRFEMMQEYDVDILKLAMMPKCEMDVIDLIKASAQINDTCKQLVISMSMGELGKLSRMSSCISGSCISFACINHSSAPGQIEVNQLKKVLSLFS